MCGLFYMANMQLLIEVLMGESMCVREKETRCEGSVESTAGFIGNNKSSTHACMCPARHNE